MTAPVRDSGVAANERLTALAGAVLLALSAVEVATLPALHNLLSVHFFVGVLLLGPLAVKLASTGWRFTRYYTGSRSYRRKGPPSPLLRALAPLLVASSLTLVGSGVALAATGPAPRVLLEVHIFSFIAWMAVLVIHLAAHIRSTLRLLAPARSVRLALNIGALAAGGIAAFLVLPSASPWLSSLTVGVPIQVVMGGGGMIALAGALLLGLLGQRRADR